MTTFESYVSLIMQRISRTITISNRILYRIPSKLLFISINTGLHLFQHVRFTFTLCLLLSIAFNTSYAHLSEDSLRLVLDRKELSSQDRLETMARLAEFLYYRRDPRLAFELLDKALKLSKRLDNIDQTTSLYALLAMQHSNDGNIQLALSSLDSAQFYAKRSANKRSKALVQLSKGTIQLAQNEPHEAIASLLLAAKDFDGDHDYSYESNLYTTISTIYGQWSDLPNQDKYARIARYSAERSKDLDKLIAAYRCTANNFMAHYEANTIRKQLLDSALVRNKAAFSLAKRNKDRIIHVTEIAALAKNIAAIYEQYFPESSHDSARYYLEIAIEEAQFSKENTVLADSYVMLAKQQIEKGNLTEAEMLVGNAIMALHRDPTVNNEIEAKIFYCLAVMKEKQGDLNGALRNYKLYVDAYTTLFNTEKMSLGKRLDAQYEAGKKEKALLVLQQQVQFNQKLNRIYIAFSLTSFLTLLFLFYAYKQRVKAMKQQDKLHQMEVNKIRQEHRISLLSAMLDGQEQERSRLARDLHDGLGGLLSGVKIELAGFMQLLKNDSQQQLMNRTLQHLDGAIGELRRIAHSMMPEILMRYGLGEAIREYCQKLKSSGINIQCQIYHYTNKMEASRQLVLYRIMQELVNNAVKHAHSSLILVQLQQIEQSVTLIVEDDGNGFDVKALLAAGKGAGLTNIESRVEFLNGTMDFHSEIGAGTTVTIECNEV